MKRRNFLQLAAMAAVAVGLPKTQATATAPLPDKSQLWGGLWDNTPQPAAAMLYSPGDKITFFNASGREISTGRITKAEGITFTVDELPPWFDIHSGVRRA